MMKSAAAWAVMVVVVVVQAWVGAAGQCLSEAERMDGANLVTLGDGDKHFKLEYHVFGADASRSDVTRLILHHGTGREGGAFGYFDQFFKAQNLAVIAPTLPGHGCSTRQPNRNLTDWGITLSAALEQENWLDDPNRGFVVAGYSFGGPHALAVLASRALEPHLKGVFVVSPTLPWELRNAIQADELPVDIVPPTVKAWLIDPSTGPFLLSIASGVAHRKVFGKLYRAMDRMRSTGFADLADWLAASSKRSFSNGMGGASDNLRLRESAWGILPAVREALSRKERDFPLVFLSEETDKIDPPAISQAIVGYVNAEPSRARAVHQVSSEPSEHDHWHYWVRFERQLDDFLRKALPARGHSASALGSEAKCKPSPQREYGPFYKPNQPYKNTICEPDEKASKLGWAVADSTFARSWRAGLQPLQVSGTVLAWNGHSCAPVAGAEIDVWQSHQYGPYGSLNVNEQDGFCRGVVRTDEQGRFSFSTFMPGSYGVLAGSGPFGPGFDVAPFVDRHIHLAVWAPGYELSVTQILHLDDPLLESGIRSAHHGYEGTGVLVQPQNRTGSWRFDNVQLAMPRTHRPSRLFKNREDAAIAFCNYSPGDILTPAVCMPSITQWVSPMAVYFLVMPASLYLWLPMLLLCTITCTSYCLCYSHPKVFSKLKVA